METNKRMKERKKNEKRMNGRECKRMNKEWIEKGK